MSQNPSYKLALEAPPITKLEQFPVMREADPDPGVLLPPVEADIEASFLPLSRHIYKVSMLVAAIAILFAVSIMAGADVYFGLSTSSGRTIDVVR